jgi:hypothetical protein
VDIQVDTLMGSVIDNGRGNGPRDDGGERDLQGSQYAMVRHNIMSY